MSIFVPVDDDLLARRIAGAAGRVVFVAPAVSKAVAKALGDSFRNAGEISITVIIDLGEDAHRVGYGDSSGLELLQKLAQEHQVAVRSQSGLRIGTLITDDDVLIWAPTPMSVESERRKGEPNGIDLRAVVDSKDGRALTDVLREAIGTDDSTVLLANAEIGQLAATPEAIAATVEALQKNPPVPVDLARQTRVLATKFAFVEVELRGAAWIDREVTLSSVLLNADAPDELRELFDTKVKPFALLRDAAIAVPAIVCGQIAYDRAGIEIRRPATQTQILEQWQELRDHYLRKLKGFGWLIHKSAKTNFLRDKEAFEAVLREWSAGFRRFSEKHRAQFLEPVIQLIRERARRSPSDALRKTDIERLVHEGIERIRLNETSINVLFKEISWESTRDEKFLAELERALTPEERKDWFEEFTAARIRTQNQTDAAHET